VVGKPFRWWWQWLHHSRLQEQDGRPLQTGLRLQHQGSAVCAEGSQGGLRALLQTSTPTRSRKGSCPG